MDQNTVWVIAIAALIVGMLLGFLFGKNGSNASREMKLADELDQAQRELSRYREEVNEHFSKTAELVNGLTSQYQKVHEHLANSAETLCRDEKLVASLQQSAQLSLSNSIQTKTSEETPSQQTSEVNEANIYAPLDYAPKGSADEPGTLSDRYGLKPDSAENPADPAKVYAETPEKRSA